MVIFWGKTITFYGKSTKYWKKCLSISNLSILNTSESSDDKCHRLSFLMSQNKVCISIGHFGAKTAFF
jgi:hypothetical protein